MRRKRATSIRALLAAAAGIGVLAAAACEGGNLFSTTGVSGALITDTVAPQVTIDSIGQAVASDTSATLVVGDSVRVRVHLQDNVGVRSVRMYGIAERGSASLGTQQSVARYVEKDIAFGSGLQDTTLTRYLAANADSTQEQVYFVVEATDSAGNIGVDTVSRHVGGTSVTVLNLPDTVSKGSSFGFLVRAKDPVGITNITWEVRDSATAGATFDTTATMRPQGTPALAEDTVDVTLPASLTGALEVFASAKNSISGQPVSTPAMYVTVATGQLADTAAPRLQVQYNVTSGARLELTDSIQVNVSGSDNGGVKTVGYTVRAISVNRGDTLTRTASTTYATAKSGIVNASFKFAPFNVDSLGLPDPLKFEITGYMIDAASPSNCAASVGPTAALPCQTLAGGGTVAQGTAAPDINVTIVAGATVMLPNAGLIMDAVVDTLRKDLYLSNIQANEVDVFDLANNKFLTPIGVGSEPWGLTINNCTPLSPTPGCGDTLIVANSGGTNLSNVALTTRQEDTGRRLLTPDAVLFDVQVTKDQGSYNKYSVTAFPDLPDNFSFSDRPEFVARDSTGRVLYSTKVVPSLSEVGTIRTAQVRPGYAQPEVRLLVEAAKGDKSSDDWRIAHVDGVVGGTGQVTFYDHVPGNFGTTFSRTGVDAGLTAAPDDAYNQMQAAGSDIFMVPGEKWNINNVGFSDTTFVTASGDGGWVAFGDGAVSPVGRVIMFDARNATVTGSISVADLMSNAGEQVEGLGLNYDGTMGVVRGVGQVSFFTTDLRLQGSETLPVAGGAGAALDPLHADVQSLQNPGGGYHPDTQLAFIGTGQQTIDIYDTFRFRRIGRVFIRDNVTGPLRAALPFASDEVDASGNPLQCKYMSVKDQSGNTIGQAVQIYQNEDFNTPWPVDGAGGGSDDRCVVVKLYGVTASGGVVVVNVRKGDILRDHPAR